MRPKNTRKFSIESSLSFVGFLLLKNLQFSLVTSLLAISQASLFSSFAPPMNVEFLERKNAGVAFKSMNHSRFSGIESQRERILAASCFPLGPTIVTINHSAAELSKNGQVLVHPLSRLVHPGAATLASFLRLPSLFRFLSSPASIVFLSFVVSLLCFSPPFTVFVSFRFVLRL